VPVEVLQRVARRMSHSSRTPSQLRTQKGEPDVTDHSHPRPEACCWTSRMVLEKFLYILLYHNRKFFNRKRGHILGNVHGPPFGLGNVKKNLARSAMRAMRGRIALLRHFMRNRLEAPIPFGEAFGVRTRPRVALEAAID